MFDEIRFSLPYHRQRYVQQKICKGFEIEKMNDQNTPTVVTERLILRRFEESDADAIFSIFSDDEVTRFLPFFTLTSKEEALKFLNVQFLNTHSSPFGFRYAICLKDNIPIGYIHADISDARDFGYALKKDSWGKGIATEAATALLGILKAAGLPFVTATHDVNNPASGKVMQKIGMRYRYTYIEPWMPKNYDVTFRMYQLDFDGGEDGEYRGYFEKYPRHFIETEL